MSNDPCGRIRRALEAQRDVLAEQIVARQYALQGQMWEPAGEPGRAKSLRDAGYHLDYLTQAVASNQPQLFSDYMAWVKALFAGLGFADQVLPTTLACMRATLAEALPPEDVAVVYRYLDLGEEALRSAVVEPPSHLYADEPLGDLARAYLEALLQADRRLASRLILEAVEGGVPVREIYLHVFQRVQRELGRLWQLNRITVAQEHLATAITQLVMSQLYPRIFAGQRHGRAMVATCVAGELHEIGVRMVADFFEMAGWDTYYLGANTPANSILDSIARQRAQVLAISATITRHVGAVADLIAQVRRSPEANGVKILVGGYPFNVAPELWRSVGADAYAPDAAEAVTVADQLVERERHDR